MTPPPASATFLFQTKSEFGPNKIIYSVMQLWGNLFFVTDWLFDQTDFEFSHARKTNQKTPEGVDTPDLPPPPLKPSSLVPRGATLRVGDNKHLLPLLNTSTPFSAYSYLIDLISRHAKPVPERVPQQPQRVSLPTPRASVEVVSKTCFRL